MPDDVELPDPVIRELAVTPDFLFQLSRGGLYEVTGSTLPDDVKLVEARYDEERRMFLLLVSSGNFADVVETLPSPRYQRLADT